METRTISVADFCHMSGLKKTTTFKLIRTNQLASTKVGSRRLISLESAQALIDPSKKVGDA